MRRVFAIMSAVAVTSCMAAEMIPDHNADSIDKVPAIKGNVSDADGTPIEYIMVTLDWGTYADKTILYTSSEGHFISESPHEVIENEGSLTITMSDIDGEENGGCFETMTDMIKLSKEDNGTEAVILDYRLTRATPSENTPQS